MVLTVWKSKIKNQISDIRYQISIFFSGSESTKNVSDKPEEIYNNSELLSPKDEEDQGNLLRGIVNYSDTAQSVVQVR